MRNAEKVHGYIDRHSMTMVWSVRNHQRQPPVFIITKYNSTEPYSVALRLGPRFLITSTPVFGYWDREDTHTYTHSHTQKTRLGLCA